MYRIAADMHIPFLKGVLEPFAHVTYLPGKEISRRHLIETDALLIRTRTRCDRNLLEGTKILFIGSATIGFDHIDTDYCRDRTITWVNAPGCNASSVMQYMASALAFIRRKHGKSLSLYTLGIVGVGNVGSRVETLARALGMNVLLNDPPRERSEGQEKFVPLRTVMEQADIITLHVPLSYNGPYRTWHLCDHSFFSQLKKKPVFINTSRGEVADTGAIREALRKGRIRSAILDVWENEPRIDPELLQMAEQATPHIAGYSLDGKANGTAMVVQALSRFLSLGIDDWYPPSIPAPAQHFIDTRTYGDKLEEVVLKCIESTYRIEEDSRKLKASPETFEEQRNQYPPRREFSAYTVIIPSALSLARDRLLALGFSETVASSH